MGTSDGSAWTKATTGQRAVQDKNGDLKEIFLRVKAEERGSCSLAPLKHRNSHSPDAMSH